MGEAAQDLPGTANDQAAFDGDKPFCDVVMKGGLTSGVVYPLAVVELAKTYRLQCIGGTSAGALAAAITAAAEYGRSEGGYQTVATIPKEIAGSLLEKFQPDPSLRPLFRMLLATLQNSSQPRKWFGIAKAAISGYPGHALSGSAAGLLIVAIGIWISSVGWILFGTLLAILGAAGFMIRRVLRALRHELPNANFGLCSGKTTEGATGPALTDWLADTIDKIAGLPRNDALSDRPLTFGDLRGINGRHSIELAIMTTDLSMRRPYRLPFRDNTHFFSKSDFAKLFPERVLNHMLEHTNPLPPDSNVTGDLHYFPSPEHVPIVVAARMSLSFPGLIQAVPIYKRDFTLIDPKERSKPVKCWFSDGGLSSNFPIHFFDRLWPNTPTFAIALDSFAVARHGTNDDRRVQMTKAAGDGQLLPINEIQGLGAFLASLLNSAKDWQDNLQSVLPGYRERIVRIALKPDEGGLNLAMPAELINALTNYGQKAGELASNTFDLDEHRWRRFLITMAKLEDVLDQVQSSYGTQSSGSEGFKQFLNRYHYDGSYTPKSKQWKEETLDRAAALVALAQEWQSDPTIRSGSIPKPDSVMRLTPQE